MTFYGTLRVKRLTLEKSIKPSNPHTQTISWLLPTNCLSVFEQFAEMTLKGLMSHNKNVRSGSACKES